MKKGVVVTILVLFSANYLRANDVSRSYFNVRPFQTNLVRQNLLVDQVVDNGRVLRKPGLEVTAFGGQSTEADKLAKYFSFHGKTELVVKENSPAADTPSSELTQDILSLNFNLDTSTTGFHSVIKVAPKQTFYGAALSGRMHFKDCYWLAFEAPIVHVKNNMHLTETIVNNGGGVSAGAGINNVTSLVTMVDAFKSADMLYGRIDGARSKTRLADLTLKFGYDNPALNRKDLFMNMYVGVVLPTGNKAEGVYMFEPICGNGGHTAFMLGSHGEIHLRKFKEGQLWMSWNAETQYLFENTQKRSFDLKLNGPWSRYLSMYATTAKRTVGTDVSATLGINLMTMDAKVTPGYVGAFETGLHYVGKKYYGGLTYTTHIRQAEKVELKNAWAYPEATITAYDLANDDTNRFRTIGTSYQDLDETEVADAVTIKEADIDLNSAAHPAAVSYQLAFNMGYHKEDTKRPYVVEGGASYEFSRQNTALNRWGIYGKLRASF